MKTRQKVIATPKALVCQTPPPKYRSKETTQQMKPKVLDDAFIYTQDTKPDLVFGPMD